MLDRCLVVHREMNHTENRSGYSLGQDVNHSEINIKHGLEILILKIIVNIEKNKIKCLY